MKFTLIEMIAVIAITAILLSITMSIMSVDPTKAAAKIIGSELRLAKDTAMTEGKPAICRINSEKITTHILQDDDSEILEREKFFPFGPKITGLAYVQFSRRGAPTQLDGSLMAGTSIKVSKDGKGNIQITISDFTGKVQWSTY